MEACVRSKWTGVDFVNLQDFAPATMSCMMVVGENDTELSHCIDCGGNHGRCELKSKNWDEWVIYGEVVEIHTSGSHWSLKELPEGMLINGWMAHSTVSEPQSIESDLNQMRRGVGHWQSWMYARRKTISESARLFNPTRNHKRPIGTPKTEYHLSSIENPQVNALRQILIDKPNYRRKWRMQSVLCGPTWWRGVVFVHAKTHSILFGSPSQWNSPFEMLKWFKLIGGESGGTYSSRSLRGFSMFVVFFVLPIFGYSQCCIQYLRHHLIITPTCTKYGGFMNETDLLERLFRCVYFCDDEPIWWSFGENDTELFSLQNDLVVGKSWKVKRWCSSRENESFMGTVVEIHTSGSHWS